MSQFRFGEDANVRAGTNLLPPGRGDQRSELTPGRFCPSPIGATRLSPLWCSLLVPSGHDFAVAA
jgi:hypothetical protein